MSVNTSLSINSSLLSINDSLLDINASLIINSSIFPTTTTTAKPQNATIDGDSIVKDSFDFKNNPGLVFVLVACLCTGLWLIFLTFYYSRLFAAVVTRLLRRFYLKDDGYLEIGKCDNYLIIYY